METNKGHIFCKGIVKFYDSSKNHFGFIEAKKTAGDKLPDDIYFKQSGLRDPLNTPRDGEKIYCYAKKGRKGYHSNYVIKEGELTSEERLDYLDLLYPKDLSILIDDYYENKSSDYKDKLTRVYNVALGYLETLDPSIWRFLYEYSPQKNKASLQKNFKSLLPEHQFKVALYIDELLEQAFEIQEKLDMNWELRSIIPNLWNNDRLSFITDDRWSNYLGVIDSNYDILFQSLESGFKLDVTLNNYIWSYSDINQLLDGIEKSDYKIDSDLLSRIFEQNIESIIPDLSRAGLGAQSSRHSFITLIRTIFSLSQLKQFHNEFTNIFINYLLKKGLEKSIQYLIDINTLADEEVNKELIDFKSKVFEEFRSKITGTLDKDRESQIITVYDSLKEIGLQDVAADALSRPSKIEIHLRTGDFDLDLSKDHKYLSQISFEGQREFFRRMLKTVSSHDDSLFWAIIDHLRADILSPEDKGYDPSTVFCMYLLLQIKGEKSLGNNPLNTTELFKYVYEKLTTQTLIRHKLSSYFEGCDGKAYAKNINTEQKDNKKKWEIARTKLVPCNFCEGTQLFDHQTGDPIVDEKTGEYKYWCRNSVCLLPSRQEESNKVYFSDFLEELGFLASDRFIGYVNGWVNKINLYLEHLTCRECNEVLKPTDIGSGYYRVSYFKCENSTCSKAGETIYLTHCINPNCNEVIDSRDTKQCPHDWYICPHCYGCCSTEKIEVRIEYHRLTNKPYHGPRVGHKDLGEVFCPDCSNSITSAGNRESYNRVLEKLKVRKTNHPSVIKCGKRKSDGKYWFLIKKSSQLSYDEFDDKINKLVNMGFGLGSDYYFGADVALISEKSESSGRFLTCENCGHSIDINDMYKEGNYYRGKAIEKWHNKIFH